MTIGKKIWELRTQKKLTQKQLSNICGFSQSALNLWENDKRKPKIESLHKIADALNVSISDLVDNNYDGILETPIFMSTPEDDVIFMDSVQKLWRECGFSSLNPPKTQKDQDKITETNLKFKLLERFEMLNMKGKVEANSQLELLTKIPEYRKEPDEPIQI